VTEQKRILVSGLALALAMTLTAAGGSFASESEPGDPLVLSEQQRDDYTHRLALTEEQAEQVQPIIDAASRARRDAMAEYGLDLDSGQLPDVFSLIRLKFAIDDINRRAEAELEPLLTDAQMREYQSIRKEREDAVRAQVLQILN